MARTEIKAAWVREWEKMRARDPRPVPIHVIAKRYGVDGAIVHRYTKHVPPPPGGWPPPLHERKFCRDEARRLEALGWKRSQIARHFGVTPPAVTRALGPKYLNKVTRRAA